MSDQSQKMDEADDDICERLELTLGEGDDAMCAYLAKAMVNNNGAAVLLLTDIRGYNNNYTRDFAYRLSCLGYTVLVPDLFHGMPWHNDIPKSEFEEWRAKHPPDRIVKDIDAASHWLLEEISTVGVTKKLGLLGFCIGGRRVFETLARDTGMQFATAVSFYPTRFDPALATQIKVPVLVITGDKDEYCAVEDLKNVSSQIEGSQTRIYAGRGHAFAHRPGTLEEEEDAEDAFLAMKSWLQDKLLSCT